MRILATLFILHATACLSLAQTKQVLKTPSTNALTESLVVPTGKTLTIDAGATITNNGTATGFGGGGGGLTNIASTVTGGTLTLAGTLTTGRTLTARDLAGTLALTSDLSAYLTTATAASTYEPIIAAGTTSQYYRGDKSWQTLNATAVGLGNVSNALQLVAANNLSDLTNTTTARSNLGLGTLATQNGTITDYLTTATAASTYASLSGSYSNPAWITGLAWSKITGKPTDLFGYGITDALSTVGGGTVVGAITVETSTFPLTQVKLDPAFPMLAFYHNGGVKGTEIIADSNGTGVNQITLPIFDPEDFTKVFALTTNADGSIANNSVTNAMLAGSIAASKLVGTDIATVGTITSGTWNGTTIAIANGGTGQTSQTNAFDALSPTTTKGDIIVHNGTDNVRVAVGATNGHVLTVDSAQASGVKWAASGGGSGGNWVLISTTTISGSPSTVAITLSGSYRGYMLQLENVYCSSSGSAMRVRTSTDGGSTFDSSSGNYGYTYNALGTYGPVLNTGTYIEMLPASGLSNSSDGVFGHVTFFDPLNSALKAFAEWKLFGRRWNSANPDIYVGTGYRDTAADVDTVQFLWSLGNFAGGKIRLFGWSE